MSASSRGMRLDEAQAAWPDAPQPWLDLSTIVSPWSYPCPVLPEAELYRAADAAALQRLSAAAKKAYGAPGGVDAVPVPGVRAGLSLLPWFFREPKRVALLAPEHAGHAAAWEAAGHSVSLIRSLDQLGKAAVLIIVNPSTADGRFIPHADLAATLPPLKRRDGIMIVDETLADAEPSHSLLPAVGRLDYTVVLRSAGAFFGAEGIGLGFAVTSHPIAERLRAALGGCPVSAQALRFGEAALSDADWTLAQRARLDEAARALQAVLEAAGLCVLGGTALFRLVAHPAAGELFNGLASQGILTRPLQEPAGLSIGLPKDQEELSRLRDALRLLQAAPR